MTRNNQTKFKETEIGPIPEEWDVVLAENFCDKVADGTHNSPKQVVDGKYLVTSKHIKNNAIDFENAYKISYSDFNEINKRSAVNYGDVLFTMIGTVGEFCQVKKREINFAIKNIGLFKPKTFDDGKWLYYYFLSKQSKEYLESRLSGSTQQYLTLENLRKYPIILPPKPNRNKIIEILGALDEKIELNRRMNDTLEKIASAIFKHWFVDFEFPNEQGKPYKSSGGKMVDSELGLIPEGWSVGFLGDIAEITSGKRPIHKPINKTDEFNIPLLGASSVMDYVSDYLYNEPILVTGRVGTHGIIQKINHQCWPSDNTLVIKSNFREFVYQLMKNIDFGSLNCGSTQPLITQSDLKNITAIIPKTEVLDIYEKIAISLDEKISYNQKQIQYLSQIRDSLLPRLMSGKIRV